MRKRNKKMKFPRVEFYEKNKRKIIDGLVKEGVPLNQVKKVFFASVNEEMKTNNLKLGPAMEKVLRSRTFTTEEENFKLYKEQVLNETLKGKKQEIKKYLKLQQNKKIQNYNWENTNQGWALIKGNRSILLQRNPDTSVEGYNIIYN